MSNTDQQKNQDPEMEKITVTDTQDTKVVDSNKSETLGTGKRVLVTIVLFGLMSSLAVEYGLFGPTLNDMRRKTNSSVQSISFLFTLVSVSSMISCLIFGPLFDKVNGLFLMGVTTIIASIALGAAPWFNSLGPLLGFFVPAGINAGTVPIGSVVLAGGLWEKYSSSLYNAVAMVYSVSLACGPLLAQPFLLDEPTVSQNTSNFSVSTNSSQTEEFKVQYAYLITSINMGVWGILALVTFYCFYGTIGKPILQKPAEEEDTTKPNSLKFNIIAYSCFFIFQTFSGGFDFSYDGYLLTFAVTYMEWSTDDGVYVTLVYQVSYIAATFFGIFIVHYIKPKFIILIDLFLCFSSSLIMFLTVNSFPTALWIFTPIIGIGYGTITPCGLAWAKSENVKGGLFNGLYWMGLYTGGLSIPPLIGYLYEAVSPMAYLYTVCACFTAMLIMYCLIVFVTELKRKGKL